MIEFLFHLNLRFSFYSVQRFEKAGAINTFETASTSEHVVKIKSFNRAYAPSVEYKIKYTFLYRLLHGHSVKETFFDSCYLGPKRESGKLSLDVVIKADLILVNAKLELIEVV